MSKLYRQCLQITGHVFRIFVFWEERGRGTEAYLGEGWPRKYIRV